jgi:hypothetical protein
VLAARLTGRAFARPLIIAIAISVPIGCGGDDDGGGDHPSAEETAQRYVDAQNDDDAATICSLYSDRLKEQIGAARNCPAFIQEQTSGLETEFTLVRVDEEGDRATAVLTASSTEGEQDLEIELRRADGGWLITSLGGPTGSS